MNNNYCLSWLLLPIVFLLLINQPVWIKYIRAQSIHYQSENTFNQSIQGQNQLTGWGAGTYKAIFSKLAIISFLSFYDTVNHALTYFQVLYFCWRDSFTTNLRNWSNWYYQMKSIACCLIDRSVIGRVLSKSTHQ